MELILNIYGQEAWHTDARIIGSKDALVELKRLIDKAIISGNVETLENTDTCIFASDGEGYKLEIICLNGWNDKRWEEYKPEYGILIERFTNKYINIFYYQRLITFRAC